MGDSTIKPSSPVKPNIPSRSGAYPRFGVTYIGGDGTRHDYGNPYEGLLTSSAGQHRTHRRPDVEGPAPERASRTPERTPEEEAARKEARKREKEEHALRKAADAERKAAKAERKAAKEAKKAARKEAKKKEAARKAKKREAERKEAEGENKEANADHKKAADKKKDKGERKKEHRDTERREKEPERKKEDDRPREEKPVSEEEAWQQSLEESMRSCNGLVQTAVDDLANGVAPSKVVSILFSAVKGRPDERWLLATIFSRVPLLRQESIGLAQKTSATQEAVTLWESTLRPSRKNKKRAIPPPPEEKPIAEPTTTSTEVILPSMLLAGSTAVAIEEVVKPAVDAPKVEESAQSAVPPPVVETPVVEVAKTESPPPEVVVASHKSYAQWVPQVKAPGFMMSGSEDFCEHKDGKIAFSASFVEDPQSADVRVYPFGYRAQSGSAWTWDKEIIVDAGNERKVTLVHTEDADGWYLRPKEDLSKWKAPFSLRYGTRIFPADRPPYRA